MVDRSPSDSLAYFSIVAVAFGMLVVVSLLTTTASDDPEGYLVVIGLILTGHGALGLWWTSIVAVRSRSVVSGPVG